MTSVTDDVIEWPLRNKILGSGTEQSSAVDGLWALTVASMKALVYIC